MTENTPTPAELTSAGSLYGKASISGAWFRSAVHRIEAVTAERDALTDRIASAPHSDDCGGYSPEYGPAIGYDGVCTCWKTDLSEEQLAEAHETADAAVRYHHRMLDEAASLEREAQR